MFKRFFYLIIIFQLSCQGDIEEYPIVIIPEVVTDDLSTNNSDDLSTNNPDDLLTYLALGDSYTIGQSVEEKDRWPNQLVVQLEPKNYFFEIPVIIARTGWTTDELDAAITNENISETYDLVTLLIGVNNQFRGRSLEEFRIQFSELLSRAILLANNNPQNVIVVSIPDWGVSPYASNYDREKISNEIDAFNRVKKEETVKRQSKFVDITEISRLALNNGDYIASDGLHFSGEMYDKWVQEIIRQCF